MSFAKKLKALFYKTRGERRKYPRVHLSIKVVNLESGNFSYYQATNLSMGGMFIKSVEPLPAGTKLEFSFSLNENKEINASGRVVRVQTHSNRPDSPPSGMGIKFDPLDSDSARAIADFISKKT